MSRKPYVREMTSDGWFFRHPRYLRYMAREFTCLFIGACTLMLVWRCSGCPRGRQAWEAFLRSA